MKKRLFALTAILALSLALAACGGAKSSMVSQPNDETGGVDVVMENADGSGVNGNVTIEEGQCLVISPNLTKGSVEVRAFLIEQAQTADDMGIGEEAALEETIDGSVLSTYDLEPGEYMLTFSAKGGATGTMMALPYSREEIDRQDAELAEILTQAGIVQP